MLCDESAQWGAQWVHCLFFKFPRPIHYCQLFRELLMVRGAARKLRGWWAGQPAPGLEQSRAVQPRTTGAGVRPDRAVLAGGAPPATPCPNGPATGSPKQREMGHDIRLCAVCPLAPSKWALFLSARQRGSWGRGWHTYRQIENGIKSAQAPGECKFT